MKNETHTPNWDSTWFYILSENEPTYKLWTVGFEDSKGEWHTDLDYNSKEEAAIRCSILNGINDDLVKERALLKASLQASDNYAIETAAERDRLKEEVEAAKKEIAQLNIFIEAQTVQISQLQLKVNHLYKLL